MGDAVFQALIQNGPFLILLGPRDMLLENVDNLNVLRLCVFEQVLNLPLGILPVRH